MKKKYLKKESGWLAVIALAIIILITVTFAPSQNLLNSGSTYSRNPEGYGGWYAFMSERGTPIQRWQKPFAALQNNSEIKSPTTLLKVHSIFLETMLSSAEINWVEGGNNLVILGAKEPVTTAAFMTTHESPSGQIKIETRRRANNVLTEILGDEYGAIVWEETMKKGKVIFAVTSLFSR